MLSRQQKEDALLKRYGMTTSISYIPLGSLAQILMSWHCKLWLSTPFPATLLHPDTKITLLAFTL